MEFYNDVIDFINKSQKFLENHKNSIKQALERILIQNEALNNRT